LIVQIEFEMKRAGLPAVKVTQSFDSMDAAIQFFVDSIQAFSLVPPPTSTRGKVTKTTTESQAAVGLSVVPDSEAAPNEVRPVKSTRVAKDEANQELLQWLKWSIWSIPDYAKMSPFELASLLGAKKVIVEMDVPEMQALTKKAKDDLHVFANGKGHEDVHAFLVLINKLQYSANLDDLEANKASFTGWVALQRNQTLMAEAKAFYENKKSIYSVASLAS